MENRFSTLDIREIRIDDDIPETEYYTSLPAVQQIIREHGIDQRRLLFQEYTEETKKDTV